MIEASSTTEPVSAAYRVQEIMREVLFKTEEVPDGKPPADAVMVEGIVRKFGLHPKRLEAAKPKIAAIIREVVPDLFLRGNGAGDGGSFLALCEDRQGQQWAEHSTMESLVVLAIAANYGGYCLPKEMWNVLPGAMPYVYFEPPPV